MSNDGRQQLVDRNGSFIALPGFGQTDDQDGAPLGSSIAVLLGLGAAYMVSKKHKEE